MRGQHWGLPSGVSYSEPTNHWFFHQGERQLGRRRGSQRGSERESNHTKSAAKVSRIRDLVCMLWHLQNNSTISSNDGREKMAAPAAHMANNSASLLPDFFHFKCTRLIQRMSKKKASFQQYDCSFSREPIDNPSSHWLHLWIRVIPMKSYNPGDWFPFVTSFKFIRKFYCPKI